MRKVKIVSVHYKTPDLIYNQYNSVRKFYPEIKYEIIDGSDDGKKYFIDLEKKDSNFIVKRFGYNIHHGPGMDYAIKNSSEEFLLILDSDVSLKKELITSMTDNFDGIAKGMKIIVNDDGFESWQKKQTKNNNFIFPYIHPYCMLINKNEYLRFNPFKKHGAPCIDFMIDVYKKNESDRLLKFDIKEYVDLIIRGTRSKWGINL